MRDSIGCMTLLMMMLPLGCVSESTRTATEELSPLQLEEIRLAIREVHEVQQRDQKLFALQSKLRERLQSIHGVRAVDVAVWRPTEEPASPPGRFVATAEVISSDDASVDGVLAKVVSIVRDVLPKPANIVAGWSKPLFGRDRVAVVSGTLSL